MFEQASIDTRGAMRSPWALAVSITGQTLIISAGILFSLVHTDIIPPPPFLSILTTPPHARAVPVQPLEPAAVRPSRPTPGVFTVPSRIPTTIDMSIHEPPPSAFGPETGPDVGIVGGTGAPISFTTIMDAIARPPAAPARADVAPPKKADAAIPRKPIAVSTGVQAAKLLRQVKPVYPQLARNARISGVVRLIAIIGKDGAIENLQVTAGHPLLTTAAVDAVKQWLYQPTLLNGEPVAVITQIDVNFTLSQ